MSLHRQHDRIRRGNIAPLAGFFMVFLVGMVAFSVDVSWIVSSQMELQNAADAAALAGAGPLRDNYISYMTYYQAKDSDKTKLNSILSSARTAAKNCAAANSAGGVTSLTLTDADIEFGYTNSAGTYSSTYTGYPNTVKVLTRRDNTSNQQLKLFFAPVIGTTSTSLTASAAAAVYGGSINSFKSGAGILPYTYDVDSWANFVSTGNAPDGSSTTYNSLPSLQVYPALKDTGNFGELSLNDSHTGASTTRSWITDGLTQDDVNALTSAGLIPLSSHPANTWDWRGNPGFKSSNVQTVNSYSGNTFILPLFKAFNSGSTSSSSSSGNGNGNGKGNSGGNSGNGNNASTYQAGTGNGSHYDYNIVQFVAVKIVSDSSNNRQIIVQPAATNDADLIYTNLAPVSNTYSSTTTPYLTLTTSRLVQ